MLERCLFLKHFCVEGPWAVLEPFSISFLLVSCSQLIPGITKPSEHYGKAIKWREKQWAQNSVCVYRNLQHCSLLSKATKPRWETGKEKQVDIAPLYDPPHADHMVTPAWRAEILVFLLLFHIGILRSLLMLKCWLSHLTLLSCCGGSVAVPQFKAITSEARPTLRCRSSSSDPSVQIPYFLTLPQLQYHKA